MQVEYGPEPWVAFLFFDSLSHAQAECWTGELVSAYYLHQHTSYPTCSMVFVLCMSSDGLIHSSSCYCGQSSILESYMDSLIQLRNFDLLDLDSSSCPLQL